MACQSCLQVFRLALAVLVIICLGFVATLLSGHLEVGATKVAFKKKSRLAVAKLSRTSVVRYPANRSFCDGRHSTTRELKLV